MITLFNKLFNKSIIINEIKKNENEDEKDKDEKLILNKGCGDILFFKVWRNKYLYNQIKIFINLYNLNQNKYFEDFQEFFKYPYREFVNSLGIRDNYYIWSEQIPWYITNLSIHTEINEKLLSKLPKTLTSLSVNKTIPIEIGILPTNIKHITFLLNFQSPLIVGFLHVGIKSVTFPITYSHKLIPGTIPMGCEYIKFGSKGSSNELEHNTLPQSMKTIVFGLNSIPHSQVSFIPEGVHTIEFHENRIVPDSIICQANIEYDINKNNINNNSTNESYIKNNPFSKSVTSLKYNGYYYSHLPFPPCIKKLVYYRACSEGKRDTPVYPDTLTDLYLNYYNFKVFKGSFPNSLKSLCLTGFNQPLNNSIPKSLTYLNLGNSFNKDIELGDLKSTTNTNNGSLKEDEVEEEQLEQLNTLIFGMYFNKQLKLNILPHSLTFIQFGGEYDKPFEKDVLPPNLNKLILGTNYNKSFENGSLPNQLKYLELNFEYNQPFIPFVSLPPNLLYLDVGRSYNYPIVEGSLPDSLTHIKFGVKFQQALSLSILPKSIKTIHLSTSYNLELLLSNDLKKNNNNIIIKQ